MNQLTKKTQNYLHYKQNFSVRASKDIIRRFGIQEGVIFPPASTLNFKQEYDASLDLSGELAQEDWNKFMDFYGSVKRDYPRMIIQNQVYENTGTQGNL